MAQICYFQGYQWEIVGKFAYDQVNLDHPQKNQLINLMQSCKLSLVILERQLVVDAMIARIRKPIQQLAFVEEHTGKLRDLGEFELLA